MVCPMRVVLVVVSAFIAGYLTWKTWESTSDILSADATGDRRLRTRRTPRERYVLCSGLFPLPRLPSSYPLLSCSSNELPGSSLPPQPPHSSSWGIAFGPLQ